MGVRKELPAFVLRAAVELPTGNPSRLLGSGGLDAGISLDRSWGLSGRWRVAAQGAFIIQGAGRIKGARTLVDQQALAVIFSPTKRDDWVLQWQSERSPTGTGMQANDSRHSLLTLGYRRRLSNGVLVLFVSENGDILDGKASAIANTGPDFTIGVAFTGVR